MNILLTNDDGFRAPGFRALCESVPPGVNAVIAAPFDERSACSHSISLGQKLRVEESRAGSLRRFVIHGTPADCVKFALYEITNVKFDLIVSGINQGANTGVSVYYSGTISAAREGLINGISSIAVSLSSREFNDFSASQAVTRELIEGYRAKRLPAGVLLNVNVPPVLPEDIKGIRTTRQAPSRFVEEFVPEKDHGEKKVYRLAGEIEIYDTEGTSDERAVSEGFISITPLKLDLTDYGAMQKMKGWLNGRGGS